MNLNVIITKLSEDAKSGSPQEVTNAVVLQEGSRVYLDLHPGDISQFVRDGKDLVLKIGQDELRIVNFFDFDSKSLLLLNGDDENACDELVLAQLEFSDNGSLVSAEYLEQSETSPFESEGCAIAATNDDDGLLPFFLVGGLGALTLIGSGDSPRDSSDGGATDDEGAGDGGSTGGGTTGGGGGGDGGDGDQTAPVAPMIVRVADDVGAVQGDVPIDDITDDTRPTLHGTAPADAVSINLYEATLGLVATGIPVNPDGSWSYTPGGSLSDGDYRFNATALDAAGNESGLSPDWPITIDTTAPIVSISDLTTSDTTPALTGTVDDPTATVVVTVDGIDYTATNNGDGTWTLVDDTLPVQPEGPATVTVTATDLASNTGTDTGNLTIDTTAPGTTVTIDSITDDSGVAGDFITNDNNGLTVGATLSAALAAGEVLMYSNDNGATWTDITTSVTGTAVNHADAGLTSTTTVQMRVEDALGNAGAIASQLVTIDATAPAVTSTVASASEEGLSGGDPDTVGTPADTTNLATVSGTMTITDTDSSVTEVSVSAPVGVTSGGQTVSWSGSFAAGTYTLNGTIDAGATPVATLTLSTVGAYTFTLEQPLDHPLEGVEDILGLDFSVTATDEAGNVSSSASLTVNVEDDMPVAADATLHTIDALPTVAPIAGDVSVTYGADGGHVARVGIDGMFLTFDPVTETIVESGDSVLVHDHAYDAGTDDLTIQTVKGETIVIDMRTGEYTYEASDTPLLPPEAPMAPVVTLGDNSLLDLIGVSALNLIDFSQTQLFAATDANNNINSVTIRIDALSISLGAGFEVAGGLTMANELGLTYDNSNQLGLLDFDTEITISALDGGPIDNQQLNEFLGAVYFSTGLANIGLLSTATITATDTGGLVDSESSTEVLNLGLLGNAPPAYLELGTAAGETLTGTAGSDRLYGFDGNDTLNAGAGADILRGGAGSDTLNGEDGSDVLMGGSGDDTLTGGTGNDVFMWEDGDQSGTPGLATAASDTVADFNAAPVSSGGDLIDLGHLLQGEGRIGTDPGNLVRYLHFTYDGTNTELNISSAGNFTEGYDDVNDPANVDQIITFNGVDLRQGLTTDHEIIENLLANGNLIVNEATASTDLLGSTTTVDVVIADGDGDTAGTQIVFDGTGATLPPPVPGNVAPIVQANEFSLLGIVGAEALTVIDLFSQDFTAWDANGNLSSVEIAYRPLISIDLIPLQLTASSDLASELGLQFSVENDPGLLGLVAPSSVLTITAVGGGDIDNLAVNELLATVEFDNAVDLLGLPVGLQVAVLDATTITATDSAGLTASDSLGNLADVSALHTLLGDNTTIIEGTSGNDALNGTADDERLYGYDGDDTITGGDGADLIRGGAGNDVLSGGDGNDVLIDGNGSDTLDGGGGDDVIVLAGTGATSIDGGSGFDTIYLDEGIDLDLATGPSVSSIERVDLGEGDSGSTLTLTEAAVQSMTDDPSNTLQIHGDASDEVVMIGASYDMAVVQDGFNYNQYAYAGSNVQVEEEVTVTV